jgi:hypothetical protein
VSLGSVPEIDDEVLHLLKTSYAQNG